MLALPAVEVTLPTITGPLIVTGKAGQPFTVQYECSQPSPLWGAGTDGDGSTINGIVPLGAGLYSITLTKGESDLVWISDVPTTPNNGCASIQVRFEAKKHGHKR